MAWQGRRRPWGHLGRLTHPGGESAQVPDVVVVAVRPALGRASVPSLTQGEPVERRGPVAQLPRGAPEDIAGGAGEVGAQPPSVVELFAPRPDPERVDSKRHAQRVLLQGWVAQPDELRRKVRRGPGDHHPQVRMVAPEAVGVDLHHLAQVLEGSGDPSVIPVLLGEVGGKHR